LGTEIERKYLVRSDKWRSLGSKSFYRQGYLLIDKSKTVRIRTVDESGFITIKGASIGISRSEFEYKIPVVEARLILETLCEQPIIEKYRTRIEVDELLWEVDEFIGENEGLIVAEVELNNVDQNITLPDWVGEEVTGNHSYNNSYLVKNPFSKWKSQ
jgi:adenylate cyclase